MPPQRKSKPRPELAALGKAIEDRIREVDGMTRETVARDSRVDADDPGIDVRRIGGYIRGKHNPRYTTLKRLCKGLHLSLREFTSRVEALEEEPPES
jgi:transcriptional regulator with XRE-family HTH domain